MKIIVPLHLKPYPQKLITLNLLQMTFKSKIIIFFNSRQKSRSIDKKLLVRATCQIYKGYNFKKPQKV